MTDAPQSAADPRPNGEPYYIESQCPDCGADLVLYDKLSDKDLKENDEFVDPEYQVDRDDIWHDEWVCPNCLDGVYMDWPDEYRDSVMGHVEQGIEDVKNGNTATINDIENALDL